LTDAANFFRFLGKVQYFLTTCITK